MSTPSSASTTAEALIKKWEKKCPFGQTSWFWGPKEAQEEVQSLINRARNLGEETLELERVREEIWKEIRERNWIAEAQDF